MTKFIFVLLKGLDEPLHIVWEPLATLIIHVKVQGEGIAHLEVFNLLKF